MVEEYLNEIPPTIYGPNKPKTSGKPLRIADLQPPVSGQDKPDTLYICCEQVVTEYERAVVFKLGRLKKGGSLGPGLHFELPCIGASR